MFSGIEVTPGDHVSIEAANWRDLSGLRHLETACFPKDAWPLLDLVGVLTLPSVIRLKAVIDDQLVGFVAGDVRSRQNMAWIATIAVLPEHQGRGIGRALLQACEKQLPVPTVRLCVRVSNEAAIHLYLAEAYQRAGLWPKYYQDGENALVMEKQLKGNPGERSQE
jgi:ribosomal protein S18 acetylase RimI-like enzyme